MRNEDVHMHCLHTLVMNCQPQEDCSCRHITQLKLPAVSCYMQLEKKFILFAKTES